jgi:hypothetical protein
MLRISDECRLGVIEKIETGDDDEPDAPANGERPRPGGHKRDKITRETRDMVDRARLQIDARKWLLSKLRPDKYGDKLASDVRFVDGDGKDRQLLDIDAVRAWMRSAPEDGEPVK